MNDFYDLDPDKQAQRLQALAVKALTHWNIGADAQLALLKHRENAVFSVHDPQSNSRYVIRIHRANYHSDQELVSELQWMEALENAGVLTPDVILASDGQLFKTVQSDGVPEPRQVDVVAWIDGKPLDVMEDSESSSRSSREEMLVTNFRTLGELTARVHNQASVWALPPGFKRHSWDIDGLIGESPFWGRFWELPALTNEQRATALKLRPLLVQRLTEFGMGSDRYSIIHADLLGDNILVCKDGLRLIDFDDAGFGWHLFEIATSLFWFSGEPFYSRLTEALLDGYRNIRPLSDEHWAMLPTFMVARGTTYLGWMHTRSETDTARELTPAVVENVMAMVTDYLNG